MVCRKCTDLHIMYIHMEKVQSMREVGHAIFMMVQYRLEWSWRLLYLLIFCAKKQLTVNYCPSEQKTTLMTAHLYNKKQHKKRRRSSKFAACASSLGQYILCGVADVSGAADVEKPSCGGADSQKRGAAVMMQHEGDASSTATESEHGSSSVSGGGAVGKGGKAASRPFRPPLARNLRRWLDKFVHSTKYHVLIVCLVVFNWFIVIVELLINLRIFELNRENQPKKPSFFNLAKILHLMNVAILGLFFMEMIFKAFFILGFKRFLKKSLEILDFAVVSAAFSLILAFGGRETSSDSAALLIVLRLWRVSKIISSMIRVVKHEAERKMAKQLRNLRALEREVQKLRHYCLQQQFELNTLQQILRQNQIDPPTTTTVCRTNQKTTLNVIAEVNELADRKHKIDKNQSKRLRTISEEKVGGANKILQYENENRKDGELDDQNMENRHDEQESFLKQDN